MDRGWWWRCAVLWWDSSPVLRCIAVCCIGYSLILLWSPPLPLSFLPSLQSSLPLRLSFFLSYHIYFFLPFLSYSFISIISAFSFIPSLQPYDAMPCALSPWDVPLLLLWFFSLFRFLFLSFLFLFSHLPRRRALTFHLIFSYSNSTSPLSLLILKIKLNKSHIYVSENIWVKMRSDLSV